MLREQRQGVLPRMADGGAPALRENHPAVYFCSNQLWTSHHSRTTLSPRTSRYSQKAAALIPHASDRSPTPALSLATTMATVGEHALPPLFAPPPTSPSSAVDTTTTTHEPPQIITQGAEALVYRTTFLSPSTPALLKYRPPKPYRHPTLDKRLTKQRILAEARTLVRLRREGVQVPGVLACDWDGECSASLKFSVGLGGIDIVVCWIKALCWWSRG